jgi:hypothetical protein
MTFINQYSMLWSSLLILGLVGFFLLRKGITLQRGLIVLGVGILLLAGWAVLRADPATTDDLDQFQTQLGSGQNVLLELQSPY